MSELRPSTENSMFVITPNSVMLQLLGYMMHAWLCTFHSAGLHELACCHQYHCADLQPLGSLPSPLSTLSG